AGRQRVIQSAWCRLDAAQLPSIRRDEWSVRCSAFLGKAKNGGCHRSNGTDPADCLFSHHVRMHLRFRLNMVALFSRTATSGSTKYVVDGETLDYLFSTALNMPFPKFGHESVRYRCMKTGEIWFIFCFSLLIAAQRKLSS